MENSTIYFSQRELNLLIESLNYYLSEAEILDKNLYQEICELEKKVFKEVVR